MSEIRKLREKQRMIEKGKRILVALDRSSKTDEEISVAWFKREFPIKMRIIPMPSKL